MCYRYRTFISTSFSESGHGSGDKTPNDKAADDKTPEAATLVWEIKVQLRRLDEIRQVCAAFLDYEARIAQSVIWIERRRNSDGSSVAVFTVAPIDIAPVLSEALFRPGKTVVCVSATLTTAGSFDFWLGRTGAALDKERHPRTGIFPSPFPYDRSVLLAVPSDAPLPADEKNFRAFVEEAASGLLEISGGSALVLFTSYESLKGAYATARPRLEALGIRCMMQGDDDRRRLLKTFLEDKTSVLFATDSFWEGVDAPGDTLRLVILCRLPFKSPNDPVFEARCEVLESRGASSFTALSLPEAVIKFRQGFGRLMRHSNDRGVVAVLDGRLLRKSYGSAFLTSLPKTKKAFAPYDDLLRDVERFLYAK
jgi:ATP-dependent DNA helicase DinG